MKQNDCGATMLFLLILFNQIQFNFLYLIDLLVLNPSHYRKCSDYYYSVLIHKSLRAYYLHWRFYVILVLFQGNIEKIK